ncbi:unnamed protein product [Rotaria socialis]|nr:unnamed protein product [Rotaria socialis]
MNMLPPSVFNILADTQSILNPSLFESLVNVNNGQFDTVTDNCPTMNHLIQCDEPLGPSATNYDTPTDSYPDGIQPLLSNMDFDNLDFDFLDNTDL